MRKGWSPDALWNEMVDQYFPEAIFRNARGEVIWRRRLAYRHPRRYHARQRARPAAARACQSGHESRRSFRRRGRWEPPVDGIDPLLARPRRLGRGPQSGLRPARSR